MVGLSFGILGGALWLYLGLLSYMVLVEMWGPKIWHLFPYGWHAGIFETRMIPVIFLGPGGWLVVFSVWLISKIKPAKMSTRGTGRVFV